MMNRQIEDTTIHVSVPARFVKVVLSGKQPPICSAVIGKFRAQSGFYLITLGEWGSRGTPVADPSSNPTQMIRCVRIGGGITWSRSVDRIRSGRRLGESRERPVDTFGVSDTL